MYVYYTRSHPCRCLFESPSTETPYALAYYSCSAAPRTPVNNGKLAKDAEIEEISRERANTIGRKSGALVFFLLKECGPITALLVNFGLGVLIVLVYPIIRLIFGIVQLFICPKPPRMQFDLGCWVIWEDLLWELVYITWAICTRMSCIFNIIGKIKRLFASEHVNAALVHDIADQVTGMGWLRLAGSLKL